MKVVLFGATGMLGQGVLRECLLADDVEQVLVVTRKPTGRVDGKLREVVHSDFTDFTSIEADLAGLDACFFCLGVSSAGLSEEAYRRITYDMTLAAAEPLARLNPELTFVYISGAGTNAEGRSMWSRVKGATENALLAMPFKAYMFRPGFIQPMHGERSSTRLYRVLITAFRPLFPLVRRLFPKQVTTTEIIGSAMLHVARSGAPKRVLESTDINELQRK
jgi:uncharacterized protein YbjT (DUF2867 family)